MAESGGPASEPGPTGRVVPCQSSPTPEQVQPGPQTPGNPAGPDPLTNSLLQDGLVQVSPHEEDSVGGCSDHTGSRSGSVEQACAQVAPQRTSAGPPPYHSVGPRTAVTPHAETCASSHPHLGAGGSRNGLPVGCGGGGDVCVSTRSPQPAFAPGQRSSSEKAQVEVCGHSPSGGPAYHTQKAQGQVEVACKPSPRRQGCDTLAAAAYCHEAGCPAQLVPRGTGLLCRPPVGNGSEDCVGVENFHPYHHLHLHQRHQWPCEETPRYGSYANHGLLEDGFTCCHPRPLPAPACTPPRPGDEEVAGQYRAGAPGPHPEGPLLTLPRLVASVSETGLDASRLPACCSLRCPWAGPLPPGARGCHAWTEERPHSASRPVSPVTAGLRTIAAAAGRDASTMTASRELRDVGVQTGPPAPPHVFPQVCLVEEGGAAAGGPSEGGGLYAKRGSLKSLVKEVKWDAEGMTWEVYGAAVDPEELGLAIQRHLELQIRETASRAAKLSRQDTTTSRHSCAGAGGKEVGKKKGRVSLGSFRPPACCARTTSAAD